MHSNIINISNKVQPTAEYLKSQIKQGLSKPHNQKTLPTMLLYDDQGLQLFDSITYLDEYYLTNAEIDILTSNMKHIIKHIPDNCIVIELGSGSLRKTKLILDALDNNRKNITYYALDMEQKELNESLMNLGTYKNVNTFGLLGTYEDGYEFLRSYESSNNSNSNTSTEMQKKLILWLGSSIGNYEPSEGLIELKKVKSCLVPGYDKLLIGIDAINSESDLKHAYNDTKGVSSKFILNALNNANSILSSNGNNTNNLVFDTDKFEFHSVVNVECGYHESCLMSKQDQIIELPSQNNENTRIELKRGELIHIEYSFKYPVEKALNYLSNSGFKVVDYWKSRTKNYYMYLASA